MKQKCFCLLAEGHLRIGNRHLSTYLFYGFRTEGSHLGRRKAGSLLVRAPKFGAGSWSLYTEIGMNWKEKRTRFPFLIDLLV